MRGARVLPTPHKYAVCAPAGEPIKDYYKDFFNEVFVFYHPSIQIVKFHGSFEYEKTIVLTETDYFDRLEFETPIDIKLRADVIGKSILFMGYSFSDYNIRYLWYKLGKMMKPIKGEEIPKSFILLTDENPIMSKLFSVMDILPIYLSDFSGDTIGEQYNDFLEYLALNLHVIHDNSDKYPVYATRGILEKTVSSVLEKQEPTSFAYSTLLAKSNFGRNEINLLLEDNWRTSVYSLGFWFEIIQKASPRVRYNLCTVLYKIRNNFYDVLVLSFLRYPELRNLEYDYEWYNLRSLVEGMKLYPISELQLLHDALSWIGSTNDLKKDTTVYYVLFITKYFEGRLSQVIEHPSNDIIMFEEELSDKYGYKLTPQNVLDFIIEKAPWVPDGNYLLEKIDLIDRILENCGCLIHQPGEFNWEETDDLDLILASISI